MAYVPTNDTVISSIRDNIEQMQAKELNNLSKTSNPYHGETADPFMVDLVQRKHWGEHLHLRDQIPSGWCSLRETARVVFSGFAEPYIVAINTKMKFSPRTETYGLLDVKAHANEIADIDLIKRISDYCAMRRDTSDRWVKVKSQVVPYLRGCKSLNEAVKHYPDIRLFCPDDLIQRLDKKVEKAERSTAAAQNVSALDTSLISASAVAASLATS